MDAIGPGSLVVCVDDRPNAWGDSVPLIRGRIYEVRRVIRDERMLLGPGESGIGSGLMLCGVPSRVRGGALEIFSISRFRPVGSLPESLTTAINNPVLEDA